MRVVLASASGSVLRLPFPYRMQHPKFTSLTLRSGPKRASACLWFFQLQTSNFKLPARLAKNKRSSRPRTVATVFAVRLCYVGPMHQSSLMQALVSGFGIQDSGFGLATRCKSRRRRASPLLFAPSPCRRLLSLASDPRIPTPFLSPLHIVPPKWLHRF